MAAVHSSSVFTARCCFPATSGRTDRNGVHPGFMQPWQPEQQRLALSNNWTGSHRLTSQYCDCTCREDPSELGKWRAFFPDAVFGKLCPLLLECVATGLNIQICLLKWSLSFVITCYVCALLAPTASDCWSSFQIIASWICFGHCNLKPSEKPEFYFLRSGILSLKTRLWLLQQE